jgi:hypothetical protein
MDKRKSSEWVSPSLLKTMKNVVILSNGKGSVFKKFRVIEYKSQGLP